MKVRMKFRKYGVMKFIGHLDVMRYFQKAMRRAEIPIAFTAGYSPHMVMSFAQPLGVGITSDGEYMDMELTEAISTADAIERVNAQMVEGMEVVDFVQISEEKKASGMTIVAAADYIVTFPESGKRQEPLRSVPKEWQTRAEDFCSQDQIVVLKATKRSEKEVDIKPLIYRMDMDEEGCRLLLAAGSEQNLKPDLVMNAFFAYIGLDATEIPVHFHRTEVYARNEAGELAALGDFGTVME